MIATLRFTLPDEDYGFNAAANAMIILRIIEDIKSNLRSALKYEEISEDTRSRLLQVQEILFEGLQELPEILKS